MPRRHVRRVVTLHAPLGKAIAHDLLTQIRVSLRNHGATDVWISHESLPDLTIMASVEDVVGAVGPDPSPLPRPDEEEDQ